MVRISKTTSQYPRRIDDQRSILLDFACRSGSGFCSFKNSIVPMLGLVNLTNNIDCIQKRRKGQLLTYSPFLFSLILLSGFPPKRHEIHRPQPLYRLQPTHRGLARWHRHRLQNMSLQFHHHDGK